MNSERTPVGALLGPYRLSRELARGGMGAVYEAVHEETGVHYALKTLLPELLRGASHEELKRFQREAEAMGRVNHANVARIHAADLDGRTPYLVQALFPGGTLQDRLKAGPMAITEVQEIAGKLGSGLQQCHDLGVLHRDLKPSNVLFDERGEPQLVDFGLAYVSGASARLTQSGDVMGTPSHMAPEQATGSLDADVRTDVYGLGALLYHCLVGAPPFRAGSLLALLAAVTTEAPAAPSAARADVPPWLDAALLRALAKKPGDRFESVASFVEALGRGSGRGSKGKLRSPLIVGAAIVGLALVGVALVPIDAARVGDAAGLADRKPATALVSPEETALEADEGRVSVAAEALVAASANSGQEASTRSALVSRFGNRPLARWSARTEPVLAARFVGRTLGKIAVLDARSLSVLDVRQDFEKLHSWPIGSETNTVLASNRDRTRLAVGQGREGKEGLVWLCDVTKKAAAPKRADFDDIVRALAFAPSGDELAVGSGHKVYVWKPPGSPKLVSWDVSTVVGLAFGPAGKRLAVARGGGDVSARSVVEVLARRDEGAWSREGSTGELGSKPSCVAVSPTAQGFVVGDQTYRVRLFSLELDRPPTAFLRTVVPGEDWVPETAHLSRVSALRFSKDGSFLYSASGSRSSLSLERKPSELRLWRVEGSEDIAWRVVGGERPFSLTLTYSDRRTSSSC